MDVVRAIDPETVPFEDGLYIEHRNFSNPEEARKALANSERWLVHPEETGLFNEGDDGFLVEIVDMPPHANVPAHKHPEDALYHVLKGSGTLDGNELRPGTWALVSKNITYSDERTGRDGVQLLIMRRGGFGATIRPPEGWTPQPGHKRAVRILNPESVPFEASRHEALRELNLDVRDRWLMEAADGFFVAMTTLSSGVSIPVHRVSEFAFWYVLRGRGTIDGLEMWPGRAFFIQKNEFFGPVTAGAEGVEMLRMHLEPEELELAPAQGLAAQPDGIAI